MKKGKYQVEMRSDDVYFAQRQVDKLFKSLLKVQGKLRVVLPSISSEEVKEEVKKEPEKPKSAKEPASEIEVTPEKQTIESVKKEEPKVVEPAIEAKEVSKPAEKITAKELPEEVKVQEEIREVVKAADVIEEKEPAQAKEEKVISEKELIEPASKIIEEVEIVSPKVEEVSETLEEVIEEEPEENLFGNILAEKTQEIEEVFEEVQEDLPQQEISRPKKTFSFKSIVSKKLKDTSSNEGSIRQKSGFKTSVIEEDEEEIIKPQDVISEEDEEIAKILEEKIKKSLPPSMNKAVSLEEPEDDMLQLELFTEKMENQENYQQTEAVDINTVIDQDTVSLEELIQLKNPQSKLDYLLLTAFYLQTNEDLFKYSLKQINSKVVPFLGSLIDHSVIHNAVAHDFIEVVPDYSGAAEVTEYRLTAVGEEYLVNGL